MYALISDFCSRQLLPFTQCISLAMKVRGKPTFFSLFFSPALFSTPPKSSTSPENTRGDSNAYRYFRARQRSPTAGQAGQIRTRPEMKGRHTSGSVSDEHPIPSSSVHLRGSLTYGGARLGRQRTCQNSHSSGNGASYPTA